MQRNSLEERLAFAKRMNWLVQTHGATIKQFCRDMGLDRKTFYGWRAGEYGPTAKTLARLAHKGVDINWLLTGKSLKMERRDGDSCPNCQPEENER
jgi:transcriptional regulator with XRE-family HTH domain